MIFQEPMASLNPCFTVGFQIGEALQTHLDMGSTARAPRPRDRASERSASRSRQSGLPPFRTSFPAA